MKTDWVNCPICGESDMRRTTDPDGNVLIDCVNHACKSNGGLYKNPKLGVVTIKPIKVHKVELLIVDHDDLGSEGVQEQLENVNFPNDCINPHIMKITSKYIGEWNDNHPLNSSVTMFEEYQKPFGH